jgi:chitin synthase
LVLTIEIVGTVTLPAAIIFTALLIWSIATPATSFIQDSMLPLIMLCAILFMPALLVVLNMKRFSMVGWMLIYLLALPIWNFVLPVYSFWHFDDFSWGKTRQVAGEKKSDSHGGKSGRFDSTGIVHRRWIEFERERRRTIKSPHVSMTPSPVPSSHDSPSPPQQIVSAVPSRMSSHERRLSNSSRQNVFLEAFDSPVAPPRSFKDSK